MTKTSFLSAPVATNMHLHDATFIDDISIPIHTVLPQLRDALCLHSRCILEAPPGTGKTTRIPLALLSADKQDGWLQGRHILMLEPRRMAARNAARYMASLLGEPVGETVGYQVRFDHRPGQRITIVTEGVLTRRLQDDPELSDIACLIFDEFHERNVQTDLGLALALDCQEGPQRALIRYTVSRLSNNNFISGGNTPGFGLNKKLG